MATKQDTTASKVLNTYVFPELGISVEAETIMDAENKAKKLTEK